MEEHLRNVILKLVEIDSNTEMFRVMMREGTATNEIRNFVSKQMEMKWVQSKVDRSVIRSLIRSNLRDS